MQYFFINIIKYQLLIKIEFYISNFINFVNFRSMRRQQLGQTTNQSIKYMPQFEPQSLKKINENNNESQNATNNNDQFTEIKCLDVCQKRSKLKNFILSWTIFLIAFLAFILIWIISYFNPSATSSSYYLQPFNISPYTSISSWSMFSVALNSLTQTYSLSTEIYSSSLMNQSGPLALSLFFSWVMWKLPLTVFTLYVIVYKTKMQRKDVNLSYKMEFATYGFYLVLLVLIDAMTTVYRQQTYYEWIFYVVYVGLSLGLIVVNGINHSSRLYNMLFNYLLPIFYFTFAYASYCYLIPGIYEAIYNSLHDDAPLIIAHWFPFIDIFFYLLIIVMTAYCNKKTEKFIKMFHFLNTGYAVGHILLFSPDQIEFYYILIYFGIRNISANWILQKCKKSVVIPAVLPGWLMIYLFSLSTNFIPLIGIGKLVISQSFKSKILEITLPIIRYTLPSSYYIYYSSNIPIQPELNGLLQQNIQISSVFIIWVVFSITQKYSLKRVSFVEFWFYIFGIYMFYIGLTAGIQLQYLQANSL